MARLTIRRGKTTPIVTRANPIAMAYLGFRGLIGIFSMYCEIYLALVSDMNIAVLRTISYLYNQQETKCSGSGWKSSGSFSSHKPAIIFAQRGWKRQPFGGLTKLGGSPGGTSL